MDATELEKMFQTLNTLAAKTASIETELKHKPNRISNFWTTIGSVAAVIALAGMFTLSQIERNSADIRDNGKELSVIKSSVAGLPVIAQRVNDNGQELAAIKADVALLPEIAQTVQATANALEGVHGQINGVRIAQATSEGNVDSLRQFMSYAFEYIKAGESIDAIQERNGISSFVISNDSVIAARDLQGGVVIGARMDEISVSVNRLLQERRETYLKMKNYNELLHQVSSMEPVIAPASDAQ